MIPAMGATIPVHGHRGARALLPENTLPSFEYAIAEGADWIELDLWATKDDILVVAHDPAMNEKICRGPQGAERVIRKMTLAQLNQWDCGALANPEFPRQKAVPGTRAPTFDEVLSLAPKGNFRFNVEIKSYPDKPELTPPVDVYARQVVDAIRHRHMEKRVMIQSFDWRLVQAVAEIAPDWPRSALFPASNHDPQMDFTEVAKQAGVRMVSVRYDTVTPEKVRRAHEAGIRVIAWTANSKDIWSKLVEAGVDEIITDDPAAAIAYLKERKRR